MLNDLSLKKTFESRYSTNNMIYLSIQNTDLNLSCLCHSKIPNRMCFWSIDLVCRLLLFISYKFVKGFLVITFFLLLLNIFYFLPPPPLGISGLFHMLSSTIYILLSASKGIQNLRTPLSVNKQRNQATLSKKSYVKKSMIMYSLFCLVFKGNIL